MKMIFVFYSRSNTYEFGNENSEYGALLDILRNHTEIEQRSNVKNLLHKDFHNNITLYENFRPEQFYIVQQEALNRIYRIFENKFTSLFNYFAASIEKDFEERDLDDPEWWQENLISFRFKEKTVAFPLQNDKGLYIRGIGNILLKMALELKSNEGCIKLCVALPYPN